MVQGLAKSSVAASVSSANVNKNTVPSFLPSFLPSLLPSFLPSCPPSLLPPFPPSFLPILPGCCFLPCFLPSWSSQTKKIQKKNTKKIPKKNPHPRVCVCVCSGFVHYFSTGRQEALNPRAVEMLKARQAKTNQHAQKQTRCVPNAKKRAPRSSYKSLAWLQGQRAIFRNECPRWPGEASIRSKVRERSKRQARRARPDGHHTGLSSYQNQFEVGLRYITSSYLKLLRPLQILPLPCQGSLQKDCDTRPHWRKYGWLKRNIDLCKLTRSCLTQLCKA